MTAPRQDTTGWICENHPFYHTWDASKVRCAGCGHTRTAVEAVESLLASSRACGRESAALLVQALRTELAQGNSQ